MEVTITINGTPVTSEIEPRTLLVHFVRENAGHAGTRIQQKNRQIAATGLADARLRGADAHPCDWQQRFGRGAVQMNGHKQETKGVQESLPWQCLYFLPLPQGQASLRPTPAKFSAPALPANANGGASWATTSGSPLWVGAV